MTAWAALGCWETKPRLPLGGALCPRGARPCNPRAHVRTSLGHVGAQSRARATAATRRPRSWCHLAKPSPCCPTHEWTHFRTNLSFSCFLTPCPQLAARRENVCLTFHLWDAQATSMLAGLLVKRTQRRVTKEQREPLIRGPLLSQGTGPLSSQCPHSASHTGCPLQSPDRLWLHPGLCRVPQGQAPVFRSDLVDQPRVAVCGKQTESSAYVDC